MKPIFAIEHDTEAVLDLVAQQGKWITRLQFLKYAWQGICMATDPSLITGLDCDCDESCGDECPCSCKKQS